jgi:uncharacterized membrane protein
MPGLLAYVLTIPVLVGLDLLWLGVVMKDFYHARLGHLMASAINWAPIAVFYVAYALGIFYFVTYPAYLKGSFVGALIGGALLGLLVYGTYDLTNMGTLKDWPLSITVVDIVWGGIITAAASAAGFWFLSFLATS